MTKKIPYNVAVLVQRIQKEEDLSALPELWELIFTGADDPVFDPHLPLEDLVLQVTSKITADYGAAKDEGLPPREKTQGQPVPVESFVRLLETVQEVIDRRSDRQRPHTSE